MLVMRTTSSMGPECRVVPYTRSTVSNAEPTFAKIFAGCPNAVMPAHAGAGEKLCSSERGHEVWQAVGV